MPKQTRIPDPHNKMVVGGIPIDDRSIHYWRVNMDRDSAPPYTLKDARLLPDVGESPHLEIHYLYHGTTSKHRVVHGARMQQAWDESRDLELPY